MESDVSVDVVEDCLEVRCEGRVEMDGSVDGGFFGAELDDTGDISCEG